MRVMWTWGELEAHQLLATAGVFGASLRAENPNDSGNKIIALAERIKAERAVAAMNLAAEKGGEGTT